MPSHWRPDAASAASCSGLELEANCGDKCVSNEAAQIMLIIFLGLAVCLRVRGPAGRHSFNERLKQTPNRALKQTYVCNGMTRSFAQQKLTFSASFASLCEKMKEPSRVLKCIEHGAKGKEPKTVCNYRKIIRRISRALVLKRLAKTKSFGRQGRYSLELRLRASRSCSVLPFANGK